MATRFFSSEGDDWSVWNVNPPGYGGAILNAHRRGTWLCFMHHRQKRRLSPIPDGWETASEEHLRAWLSRATPVRKRRRRASGGEGKAERPPPAKQDELDVPRLGAPLDQEIPLRDRDEPEHPFTVLGRGTTPLRIKRTLDD